MTDLTDRIDVSVEAVDGLELASTGCGYRPSGQGQGEWVASGQIHAVLASGERPVCGYQLPVLAWDRPWSDAVGDLCPTCTSLTGL